MGIFGWLFGGKPKSKSPQQVEAENRLLECCAKLERSLDDNAPGLSRDFREHKMVDAIIEEYRKVMAAFPNSSGEIKRILGLFTQVYARTALTVITKGLGLKNVAELIARHGADADASDDRGVIFIKFTEPPTDDPRKVQKIGIALKAAFETIEPGCYADVDWLEPEGIGSFIMSRNFIQNCFFDDKYRRKLVLRAA